MDPAEKMLKTFQLVLIALVGITGVWLVADIMITSFGFPPWLKFVVTGIAIGYIYYTRDEIMKWLKK